MSQKKLQHTKSGGHFSSMITGVSGKINTNICLVRITETNSLQLNLVDTSIGNWLSEQLAYQLRQKICAEAAV